MRQFAGFSSPEETNDRFKYLMEQGQTGLSVAYDLPALMGYDADSACRKAKSENAASRFLLSRTSEVLFDGIPLEDVTVSQTINAPASVFLAMYLVVAEKQRGRFQEISGTLQNDILKEYIAQKEWIYPIKPAMKLVIDTLNFAQDTSRNTIRSPFPAITSAKPVRPRCRNSRSRCATASSTVQYGVRAGWTSTNSCRASRSFLTRTTIFLKRSRSIGRLVGFGRVS